ncbi:MAG: hypothetical protein WC783_04435 [Candidatus Paceibacterota bacterium]|jgi:hypothetical protein
MTDITKIINEIVRVEIPPKYIKGVENWAAGNNFNYSDSKQSNTTKNKTDHIIGKIGEVAVAIVYISRGIKVIGPNLNNYGSWNSDLIIGGTGVGVKTQELDSANKYGTSWTFQLASDGHNRHDPVLDNPNAYVTFVKYDQKKALCWVYPIYQIKDLKFDKPRLEYLEPYKTMVYENTLPNIDLIKPQTKPRDSHEGQYRLF